MTVLTILEVPDPGLRAVAAPVSQVDDSIRATLADMFETMYAARGIGSPRPRSESRSAWS